MATAAATPYRKTPEAARELGVSYHTLFGLVRFGSIAPPARDSSGDYVWTPADLGRARKALDRRRREPAARRRGA